MTRKDYKLIAAYLKDARPSYEDLPVRYGWSQAVDAISRAFRTDNPRFDQDKFIRAVGRYDRE